MFSEDAVRHRVSAIDSLRLSSDRALTTLGFAALAVPAVLYARSDIAQSAGDWRQLRDRLAIRAVMVAAALAGVVAMRVVKTRVGFSRAVLWLSLMTAVLTVWLNAERAPGAGLPLRSPMLILAVMYFAMPSSLWRQCAAPLLMSAGLLALRVTKLSGGPVDVQGDVIALLSMNALGVLAVARRLSVERATHQVVVELRALQGIIPICSYCRQVRSELGSWQGLERYVHDHSDAAFSHGICPDCLPKVQAQFKEEAKT